MLVDSLTAIQDNGNLTSQHQVCLEDRMVIKPDNDESQDR